MTLLSPSAPLIVWAFTDGKPGHMNQVEGLLNGLAQLRTLRIERLLVKRGLRCIFEQFAARTTKPDLIIGAGHATHLPMLAARLKHGGKTVLLMRPSLPTACFDLCLIPRHDGAKPGPHIEPTEGVLNKITASDRHDPRQGLILIGGPSRHHGWNDEAILKQVMTILESAQEKRWILATSRRTPPSFYARLDKAALAIDLVYPQDTTPQWLPIALARAGTVWVSEDSISMIYEALTSGAEVGVLEVPRLGASRVSAAIEALKADGHIADFSSWQQGRSLHPMQPPLNEAMRCAKLILERLKL